MRYTDYMLSVKCNKVDEIYWLHANVKCNKVDEIYWLHAKC